MSSLVRRLSSYLTENWNNIPGFVRWSIEQVAGTALVEAVVRGFNATVSYLSTVSSSVLEKIASLLGI